VVELSGGNQQKVAIGRWLDRGSVTLGMLEAARGAAARL
jgi:ABC-type sugar transport system ATPase subunit